MLTGGSHNRTGSLPNMHETGRGAGGGLPHSKAGYGAMASLATGWHWWASVECRKQVPVAVLLRPPGQLVRGPHEVAAGRAQTRGTCLAWAALLGQPCTGSAGEKPRAVCVAVCLHLLSSPNHASVNPKHPKLKTQSPGSLGGPTS